LIAPCVSLSYVDFFSYSFASDGESLSSSLLLGETGSLLVGFGDAGGLLVALEFNMAVAGKVGRNSTMGSVSASTSGDGSLADGVVDDASLNIESLLFSVSFEVAKEILNGLDGLLGPSSKFVLENLALGVTTNTTGVHSEGDDSFFGKTSVHVLDSFLDFETLACAGNIVRVLVMDSEVTDLGHGGYISNIEQQLGEKKESDRRTFSGLSGLSGVLAHWKLIPIY
jgi:hypothetical protein